MTDGVGWPVLLKRAALVLENAGVSGSMGDARRLLAHGLGIDTGRLTLALHEPAEPQQITTFNDLIAKRATRQPVSQIIGLREFYGRQFRVSPDVLDPRPDTETLIDVALEEAFETVLDMGTGSGCVLVTLLCERGDATGIGSDLSSDALRVAAENSRLNGVHGRSDFITSDWFDNVEGQFDLIVSNPPYVSAEEYRDLEPEVQNWEPRIALTPGGDGLDAYRAITAGAMGHLSPGGRLIVEVGPTQASAVNALFSNAGFQAVEVHKDIDGRDRVVKGTKDGNNPP